MRSLDNPSKEGCVVSVMMPRVKPGSASESVCVWCCVCPSPRVCGDLQADAKCFQSIAHSYLPTCPNQRVSLSFQWVQRDRLHLFSQWVARKDFCLVSLFLRYSIIRCSIIRIITESEGTWNQRCSGGNDEGEGVGCTDGPHI